MSPFTGPGQQSWHPPGESGQQAGPGSVELLHVAVGERAQERPECRGRTTPVNSRGIPP